MTADELRRLLETLRSGGATVDATLDAIRGSGDLTYATIDLDRAARCGFPEVVLAEGKTPEWAAGALRRLMDAGQDAFATRVSPAQAEYFAHALPGGEHDALARTYWLPSAAWVPRSLGRVVVVTAGTGDLPVAQEAVVTARVMGASVELVVDVGVAGVHRLLAKRDVLASADVVIAVAGMDGALPSVVGGLIDAPVIAVPTSVGYGAAFGGVAALLTMLNSCSAGVCVVNIDAGFKAGYVAARVVRRLHDARSLRAG